MAASPHVLVVGAGIIGASIAWHLVRAGARVTVLEAGRPGGLATRGSWAWINASRGNPEPYFRLRSFSMRDWRRLEREVPGLRVAWSGGLSWDLPPDELEAFAAEHAAWGYDIRRVDRAEVERLEPQLAAPPEFAVHARDEGAVEPVEATLKLLEAAQAAGAEVIPESRVRALALRAGRVTGVETETGRLAADEVVVAAGAETADLLATAGIALPLSASPGLLIVTAPHAPILKGLVMAPELHMRQTPEGRLIAGGDFGGSDPGDAAAETAAELFATLQGLLRKGAALDFETFTVGQRVIPGDGFPAVGRAGDLAGDLAGLYVAVMHSGVTLAPAVGRFAAEEITTGRRDPLLAPYGPARFLSG